jgi:hypothetical protein
MSIRTVSTLFRLLPLVAALLLSGVLPAQPTEIKEIEKGIPPIKLATTIDEEGLKQWGKVPHQNCMACKAKKLRECTHCKHLEKPVKCPACKLTRKAACNVCAGAGKLSDPLKFAPCPGCNGHGVVTCDMCQNRGGMSFVGGGKRPTKCGMCKGNAGITCPVCNGKRLVRSAFKGKVGTVPLKKLLKAKAQLSKLITQVQGFTALGKPRKDRKKFAALFKKTKSDFPPLKKVITQVNFITKGLDTNIKDIERTQVHAFDRVKYYVLYYLLHQSKVLDLCIERAKFNEDAAKKRG